MSKELFSLSGHKVCDSSGIQIGPVDERSFFYRCTVHRFLYDTVVSRCPYKQHSKNRHISVSFHSKRDYIKRALTSPNLKLPLA